MRILISIILAYVLAMSASGQAPSVAASNVIFGNTYCSQSLVSWTNGNGDARIVIASKNAAVTSLPANNNYYLASPTFGAGYSFSSNEFVVFNGFGNSVTVSNLEKNTTYYFSVFEYNGGGLVFSYSSTYAEASINTKNITADFSIDDSYQCENGNNSVFTSSSSQDAISTLVHNWNFGDGNTASTVNTSHSYATYKIYQVTLIVSSLGCKDTMIREDTIAPKPDVVFSLLADSVAAGYTQQQCFYKPDGSSNYFYFKSVVPFKPLIGVSGTQIVDATDFFWYYGDGNEDKNVIDGHHGYSSPGVYPVKLVLITTNNYIEFCSDSFEFNVEVFPSPIDSSLLAYDTLMCLNNNVFSFKHNTSNSGVVHNWDFGDGSTGSGSSTKHSYEASKVYQFRLDATDQNSCFATYTDSVEVVPQPNNQITGLDPVYCEGDDAVKLSVSIEGGDWIPNTIDRDDPEFTPITLGLNVIKYTIDVNGCLDTAEISTAVNPVPKFELGPDTSICAGSSLTKSVSKGGSAVLWSTGSKDSFATTNSSGQLWAEKTRNGCSFRDELTVTVINSPTVDLGRDSLLCGDGKRSINIQAAEATYLWNDGYAGGGKRDITSSGDYSVTVVNKCGSATDEVSLEFLPYVCDIFIPNAFSPNGDGLNDVFQPSGNVEIKSMYVFSRWGEKLYSNLDGKEQFGWDGLYQDEKAQIGNYFFIIHYLLPEDGYGRPRVAKGEFYLID